jgi:predicted flap endonuclease-1-like 5' DNA nuclease
MEEVNLLRTEGKREVGVWDDLRVLSGIGEVCDSMWEEI